MIEKADITNRLCYVAEFSGLARDRARVGRRVPEYNLRAILICANKTVPGTRFSQLL